MEVNKNLYDCQERMNLQDGEIKELKNRLYNQQNITGSIVRKS